ncbi:MAG: ATP-binding protein [Firmicutes bacterium]|nr:ATP-binding protein [Bacillota bacterium]
MTEENDNKSLSLVADTLFEYLRDVIYCPEKALLDVDRLPAEFRDFGMGLVFFSEIVTEAKTLAKELAGGNLNCALPSSDNEIAAPLKMLHASLRHLTWQTQQVAKGDYQQRVDFMGDFSEAYNNMVKQLERRWNISLDEKSRLQRYVNLLLANCPDPILLFGSDKRLAFVSDSYLKNSEIPSVKDVAGKHLRELFTPLVSVDFIGDIENMFDVAFFQKQTQKTEHTIDFGHNGHLRHYQIQLTPMLDTENRADGVMILLHDTTELVKARLLAEKAKNAAQRSSQAKSDFLARMSHEMRTPMNAIMGMTAISWASDDIKRKDYCNQKISEASRHLLGLIDDVLDMSNIESDKFTLSYSKFDFGRMIDFAVRGAVFAAKEHNQELTVEIAPNVPKNVISDERRVMQIIKNLLSNAVKFTPNGGKISLSARKTCERGQMCNIQIEVKDNGIGISKKQQKMLFRPFEQIHGGADRKFGGIGLGLTISKHVLEMMGGGIDVESVLSQGSKFTVRFPVEKVLQKTESGREEVVNNADGGIFAGYKILLAEDVEINREILVALLEDTGVTIDCAADGREAVEKFALSPGAYDLILMDINMPNMDGYKATNLIRASGLYKADTIPIIALTANTFKEDIDKCIATGMNSHLKKPIDIEKIIEKLKEYML